MRILIPLDSTNLMVGSFGLAAGAEAEVLGVDEAVGSGLELEQATVKTATADATTRT
jgi:hypothetical protein